MPVLALLGSILSGGATGLLGTAIQRYADHKNKKLDLEASKERFAQEIALKKVDAEIMAQEWAARTKVAEVEGEARVEVADAAAFSASFNEPQRYTEGLKLNKKQGWFMVLLDFIRGMVRPGLTIYLCSITTLIYFQAYKLLDGNFILPTQALDLVTSIINTILYLTTTCVLWWFGTRNKSKQP